MVAWIESLSTWDRRLPAVLIVQAVTSAERHAKARSVVAAALGDNPASVVIEHVEGRPPTVVQPIGSGLFLSIGSRDPLAAVAVARSRIGVDVEAADPKGEIPWNVLHPDEAALLLAGQDDEARAHTFSRLWSLKEAYLKALGTGLSREPAGFAATFLDERTATIRDPAASGHVVEAVTAWRAAGDARVAISAVVLNS